MGLRERRGPRGSELLIAREHLPNRPGELAGDVEEGDLGPALLAQAALVALVALRIGGMAQGVYPPEYPGSVTEP